MQPQSAALKLAVGMMVKAEKPDAIVCDVNETLFSLEPFRKRLQAVGLPEWSLEVFVVAISKRVDVVEQHCDYLTPSRRSPNSCSKQDRNLDNQADRLQTEHWQFLGCKSWPPQTRSHS